MRHFLVTGWATVVRVVERVEPAQHFVPSISLETRAQQAYDTLDQPRCAKRTTAFTRAPIRSCYVKISQPTPEIPVPDVRVAQEYYRDTLGFEINWTNDEGRIGAVSHGDCAIFFRESTAPSSGVFWVFSEDVDAAYAALSGRGADIAGPPADTPWGLRQFTVRDAYGTVFHIFHDL